MLHTNRSLVDGGSGQINIDMALKNANAKLSQWTTKWENEMGRGERWHLYAAITTDAIASKRRIVSFLVPQLVLPVFQPLPE